jgi:glycosyltransferase involved in cell wall biosynthesis
VQRLAPDTALGFLRRGIDVALFHPCRRDRVALEARFGIPPGRTLLLFVGRLDPVKGVLIAAEVVHRLATQGRNVHLLVVGHGTQRQQVAALLGERGTLTGNLPYSELASIYASTDLLLFPSEAEVWPNVVIEARACGLPVIACEHGASHVMQGAGKDGLLLPDRHLATWLTATQTLLDQPGRLQDMGRQARRAVEMQVPSWRQVLEADLLPTWRAVAERK